MVRALRRLLATGGALTLLSAGLAAQEPATITGTVNGEDGKPIPGATVSISEMGLGATTRSDGKYTVNVPAARVQGQRVSVTARAINFKAQVVYLTLVPGPQSQDFSLVANPLQLGEIVVTGAGTTTEVEKLGNVRNEVTADAIVRTNYSNVVEALAGQAPNVQVTASSGEPGAGSYITIRGNRTIGVPNSGSNQPLFVVDGTPIDNSSTSTTDFNPADGLLTGAIEGTAQMNRAGDINPEDIESIEILKGATAAAIYGSRAAQGVVLITTKKGKAGPTRWSIKSSAATNDVTRQYPLQTTYGQGLGGVAPDSADLGGPGGLLGGAKSCTPGRFECRTSWGPKISAVAPGATIYDHANEAYVTGFTSDNTATVSGGNDRTTFFASGSYLSDRGVFSGDNNIFKRTTVRFNGSHRLADNFKLGANVSYADSRAQYVQRGNNTNGLQLDLLRSPPEWNNTNYLSATGQQITFRNPNPNANNPANNPGWNNPYYTLYNFTNQATVGRVYGNLSADWDAVSWLKFAYTLGADYSADERLEGGPRDAAAPINGGRVTEAKLITYQIDHNLTGTAKWRSSPNLAGTVTLGQNLNVREYRDLGNVGRTLLTDSPFRLSNTLSRDQPIDNQSYIHGESYFGQATVDIYNELYLTGALRNDGSSTYDKDHRRAWFPKASAAWEFTKAAHPGSWLSYGKARASYGEAGTEPAPYLTTTVFNNGLTGGISQGTAANVGMSGGFVSSITKGATSLKPERTKEWEAGVDLGLIKDRVDLSYTYYHATSSDVILITPLPPSTGYLQSAQNSAQIRNFGHELSINARIITSRDFSWDIGLQWAKNQSRVLSLTEGINYVPLENADITPLGVAKVGEPVGVFYGTGLIRCGVSDGSLVLDGQTLSTWCGSAPKGAIYLDANGLPVHDATQRVVGDPNPTWTGSVRTGFRIQKFQITGLLDIKHGGQMYNGTRAALLAYGTHKDTEVRADCYNFDFGVGDGLCHGNEHILGTGGSPLTGPTVGHTNIPVAIGENWYTDLGGLFNGTDEQWIEDAGFVKLREISLGYTLDQPSIQKALGFIIDLRVSARNLKTWTSYTGYDPETNLGQNVTATRGKDYFNMPQTRQFLFSVTLSR